MLLGAKGVKATIVILGLLVAVMGAAGLLHAQTTAAENERMLMRVLAEAEQKHGKNDPLVAMHLRSLGSVYAQHGKYALAEKSFRRAIKIWEKYPGNGSPSVDGRRLTIEALDADIQLRLTLDGLARLYMTQGRYTQAEPIYKRIVTIETKGDKKSKTSLGSMTFYDHVHVCLVLKRYSEAEQLCLSVTVDKEKLDYILAEVYRAQKRYAEAEPLYERALEIQEKSQDSGKPVSTQVLRSLAALYRDQRRYAEAEELLKRALEIDEKAEEKQSIRSDLRELGGLYRKQKRYEEAEEVYTRAVVISDNRTVMYAERDLNDLAELYREQGRYAEAEPLAMRAVETAKAFWFQDHPENATYLNNLGELYCEQKRYKLAEPLFRQALQIRTKALGDDHPDVAEVLENMAVVYRETGRASVADDYSRRAAAIRAMKR